jgi:hypothetical protein
MDLRDRELRALERAKAIAGRFEVSRLWVYNIDCGCFGSGKPSPLKTWLSLGRDLLLLAAALLTYRANFKKTRPSIEVIANSPNVAA